MPKKRGKKKRSHASDGHTDRLNYTPISDGEIAKKCRSVFDVFDVENYKQACKLVQGFIRKYGPKPRFYALQAIVYARINDKHEESVRILQELTATNPTNDTVINYIITAYRMLNQPENIVVFFEHLASVYPQDEEILLKLYFAYVRSHEFVKQQRVAAQMYQKTKKPMYLFWSCVSMLLVHRDTGANKMLQLSEMMLKRHFKDKEPLVPQQTQLLMRIMMQQGRYDEALALLGDERMTKQWKTSELPLYRLCLIEVYRKLGRWSDVSAFTWKYLSDSEETSESLSDDWEYWQWFIDAEIAIGGDNVQWNDILARVQGVTATNMKRRGPFLAEMQVVLHIFEVADYLVSRHGYIAKLLQMYFAKFAHKPCFFQDVYKFVCTLPNERIQDIVSEVTRSLETNANSASSTSVYNISDPSNDVRNDEEQCRRRVSAEQLRRCAVYDYDEEKMVAEAARLYSMFTDSYRHLQANLEPKERGAGDDYILLCAHYLLDAYETSQNPAYIRDAIAVLECGVVKSPYNYQMRLQLVRLYCHPCVGGFQCAQQHYESLSIKQPQLDSMSHHLVNDAWRYAYTDTLETQCRRIIGFHGDHLYDSAETTVVAHKHRSYDKIVEFVKFAERLRRSHQLAIARVELFRVGLTRDHKDLKHVRSCIDTAEIPPQCVDDLIVNHDLSVLLYWSTPASDIHQYTRRLNRSAPSTATSSFDTVEYDDEWCGFGDHISAYSRHWLQFQWSLSNALISALNTSVDEESKQFEAHVSTLTDTVTLLKWRRVDDDDDTSFESTNWSLLVSLYETCHHIREASSQTNEFIAKLSSSSSSSSSDTNEAMWTEFHDKWQRVSEYIKRVHDRLTWLIKYFRNTLYDGVGDDNTVRLEVIVDHPTMIVELWNFIAYIGVHTCILIQLWREIVPKRKSLRKLFKTKKLDDTMKPWEERVCAECLTMRDVFETMTAGLCVFITDIHTAFTDILRSIDADGSSVIDDCVRVRVQAMSTHVFAANDDVDYTETERGIVMSIAQTLRSTADVMSTLIKPMTS